MSRKHYRYSELGRVVARDWGITSDNSPEAVVENNKNQKDFHLFLLASIHERLVEIQCGMSIMLDPVARREHEKKKRQQHAEREESERNWKKYWEKSARMRDWVMWYLEEHSKELTDCCANKDAARMVSRALYFDTRTSGAGHLEKIVDMLRDPPDKWDVKMLPGIGKVWESRWRAGFTQAQERIDADDREPGEPLSGAGEQGGVRGLGADVSGPGAAPTGVVRGEDAD